MKKEKYYLALDDYEKRVIINCLNKMRNCLISKGKYTGGWYCQELCAN